MNFNQRSYEKEMMDAPSLSAEAFHTNLEEIVFINRYLGGANVSWSGINQILNASNTKDLKITDIGAGAADAFAYMEKKRPSGTSLRYEAVDIQHEAKTCSQNLYPELLNRIEWVTADYREVFKLENKTDIVMANLFCHHLNDSELTAFLKGAAHYARLGIVINDLHRHPLAFHSIKILTQILSKSELTKNDAPLSVLRGFTENEWVVHLRSAGLKTYNLSWKWAFRHLIVINTKDYES